MIKIHIEAIPSSNNVYQGQGSKSKAIREYPAEKKAWAEWIWFMRKKLQNRGELDGYQLPLKKATVIMIYHFKSKARRDPDNYSGKMILDGLKDAGFISDDSFKELDILPLADFGKVKTDSVDIHILEGKRLEAFAKSLMERGDPT